MATLQNLGGQLMQIMVIAILVVSTLVGMNRGLIIGIYALLRNAIVVFSTIYVAPIVGGYLPAKWGDTRKPVSVIITVIVLYIIVHLLCRLIRLGDDVSVNSTVDKVTGTILGLGVGLILTWGVLLLFGTLTVFPAGEAFAKGVRGNGFDMWFQGLNPFISMVKSNGFKII